jgi:hypothetical protein
MVSLISSSDSTRMRFDHGLSARMDPDSGIPQIDFSYERRSIVRLRGGVAERIMRLLYLGAATIVEVANTRKLILEPKSTPVADLSLETFRSLLSRLAVDGPHPDWTPAEAAWSAGMREGLVEGMTEILDSSALTIASFLAARADGIPIHNGISWLEWAFGVERCAELFRDADSEPGAISWEGYQLLYPDVPAIGVTFVETPAEDLAGMSAEDRAALKILDHEGRPQNMKDFDESTAVECDLESLCLVVPMARTHPDAALMIQGDDGVAGIILPQLVDMAEIADMQARTSGLMATHFFPLHSRFLSATGKKKGSPIIETE